MHADDFNDDRQMDRQRKRERTIRFSFFYLFHCCFLLFLAVVIVIVDSFTQLYSLFLISCKAFFAFALFCCVISSSSSLCSFIPFNFDDDSTIYFTNVYDAFLFGYFDTILYMSFQHCLCFVLCGKSC